MSSIVMNLHCDIYDYRCCLLAWKEQAHDLIISSVGYKRRDQHFHLQYIAAWSPEVHILSWTC